MDGNTSTIVGAAYYFHNKWQSSEKTFDELNFYSNQGKYLGRLNSDQYKAGNQDIFDSKIDKKAPSIEIKSVVISCDPQMGRTLRYLNEKKEYFPYFYHECPEEAGVLMHNYQGPIDIKKAQNDLSLIKPHSLLNSVKRVEEYDYFTHPLLFLTFHRQEPYLKKTLIYNDNGTTTEITSREHRMVQGAQALFGLGFLYTGYLCYSKIFSKVLS